jgi:hypothetical protein
MSNISFKKTEVINIYLYTMASITDIIKQTVKLITDSTDFFDEVVKDLEISVQNITRNILSKFNQTDGKFDDDDTEKLVGIDDEYSRIVEESGLRERLDQYRTNFDLLEELETSFFEETLREPELEDLVQVFRQALPFKSKIIDDLDQAMLGNGLSDNILKPIRDDIFEAVILKTNVQDLEAKIADSIASVEGNNSRMLSYVKQIARDSLRSYHGAIQERARVMYDLDKMTYSGAVIDTTRMVCYDLLRSLNRYAELAIKKGQYRVEDIEEIIRLFSVCEDHHTLVKKRSGEPVVDCGSGTKPTVLETFSMNAGGYGCLHLVYYSRLTARDKKIIEEKGIGS